MSAVRNSGTGGVNQHFSAPIEIVDAHDDFLEGIYDLVVGVQTFVLTKVGGKYQPIL